MIPSLLLTLATGRQTIDLDAGWSFARVPQPPPLWSGPDAVPTGDWRVKGVSSEETAAENGRARNAFDGRSETIWHSAWSDQPAPFPHWLEIDLGSVVHTVGFRLLPRQTGAQNGKPNRYRLSLDGKAIAEGAVPDSLAPFEVRFPEAQGRTLRLDFLTGHAGEPFLAISEIGLIRPNRQGTDWASQYNVANVLTGDARFDPTPAEADRLRRAEFRTALAWSPAVLPHAAWVRPLNTSQIWQGAAYYRRRLPAPPPGRRTELVLQGMQRVDLWLNGRYLAGRTGGYLPLRTPIREGGDLLVRVDNSDNPLIPPGKPQSELDFMYGNGLIGHAALVTTDPLHISDPLSADGGIRVEPPILARDAATVSVQVPIRNDGAQRRKFVLRQFLFDGQGERVASVATPVELLPGKAKDFVQSLRVTHPKLWSPDSPSLYRLRTCLEEKGRASDAVETRIGLRTIEVSREKGFLLNGKPLRLVGTNRHQDYPWVGPALSDAANRRDALLIKRSGHNIVRLSHYNQSPAFLDACDELGILTIPCIPGWQFVNRDPRFSARVLRDIRETIRRDRNHPSVAFWEASLNETYPPAALAKSWHDAARAEGALLTAGDEGKGMPWEVTYNGWRDDLSRPSNSDRPGYIREYGDFEFGGGDSTSRVRIGQGMTRLLEETWNHVWSLNKFRPLYPSTMGAGTWEMFDHNVPWNFAVSASGLADLMRREKPSFWFFRSQQERAPYLKVAADWQTGEPIRTVVVFTNATRATLSVNGRPLRTEAARRGPETPYDLQRAFDGTNSANLPHPPIVFRNVPFTPGTLKVVGENGASDVIRTAGPPARLKVWIDDLGVPPTRNDLVFVRAAVVDNHGVLCANDARQIAFRGASFAGEASAPCEMGIASVLVRTPLRQTLFKIAAEAGGLHGEARLEVR